MREGNPRSPFHAACVVLPDEGEGTIREPRAEGLGSVSRISQPVEQWDLELESRISRGWNCTEGDLELESQTELSCV